jgi:uncharacterized protein (TIGR02646 family)
MKQIIKKEPEFFSDYLKKESPTNWGALSRSIGQKVREYMLNFEQNAQCAYTEIAITPDSIHSHIDHYKKQNLFAAEKFKWNNLFACCNSEYYGAKYKDKHIKKEDYKYLLNPFIDNPNDYFHYSISGKIIPKSMDGEMNIKAITTIDLFFLDNKALVERRAIIAEYVNYYANQLSLFEIKAAIGEFDNFVESIYTAIQKEN